MGDDVVVALEDAIGEVVVAQELPDVLDRVEFRGARRQWKSSARSSMGGSPRGFSWMVCWKDFLWNWRGIALTMRIFGPAGLRTVTNYRQVRMARWRYRAALHVCVALCTYAVPVAAATSEADKVFVQCSVLQGNGYNWAATLGWLAGQVEIAAVQAKDYETRNPGRSAGIDLACVTGSSSGGFAAALFDRLLHNPHLVGPSGAGDQPVSPATAKEISRALLLLALSTDFRDEDAGLALTGIGTWAGLLDRTSNPERLRAWRAASTPDRISVIFNQWILAAGLYRPEWFDALTDDGATPIPIFRKRSGALGHDAAHGSDEQMRVLAARARRIVSKEISGWTLPDRPPGNGFCATALVTPIADQKLPFDFDQLSLVVGCNATTFAALTRSPSLMRWLAQGRQMADRLLLAQFDSWSGLLNMTVREPELVTPLTGGPDPGAFGIEAAAGFDGARFVRRQPTSPFLVLGGFAGPRLQAWPATALLTDRLASLRAAGISVEGRIALFGRTERRSDPGFSFAQRAIRDYFARDGDPLAALTAFHAWQDEYCVVVDALPPGMPADFYRMDWNLSPRPAALTRESRILAAKGYNLGKVQTSRDRIQGSATDFFQAFLFDPIDTEVFVPTPPRAGMRCRLQERDL